MGINNPHHPDIEIEGTITIDGETHNFAANNENGWQQWGAPVEQLGKTIEIMEKINAALYYE